MKDALICEVGGWFFVTSPLLVSLRVGVSVTDGVIRDGVAIKKWKQTTNLGLYIYICILFPSSILTKVWAAIFAVFHLTNFKFWWSRLNLHALHTLLTCLRPQTKVEVRGKCFEVQFIVMIWGPTQTFIWPWVSFLMLSTFSYYVTSFIIILASHSI